MANLSFFQQLYYRFLGFVFAFAYHTNARSFLGAKMSSWCKFLSLVLPIVAWTKDWPGSVLGATLALMGMVWMGYWWAARAGYSRFVGDGTAVMQLTQPLTPLPPYQRVHIQATGLFSVHEREDYLLLRSAEYWQVPLGDHIIMAEQSPKRYLYQFFNAKTLQEIKSGWLIFGSAPRRTLAITFALTWGPQFADEEPPSWVASQNGSKPKITSRTIYFTPHKEEDEIAILHTILHDARMARSAG